MKVAFFGSTGFVGSYILKELIKNNYEVKALVRTCSKLFMNKEYEHVIGDIKDEVAVHKTIVNSDAIIYNIGIIREFPKAGIRFSELHYDGVKLCIKIAEELSIKRFILMSANGVKKNGTKYQSTKFFAEQELKKSNLDWTIFRPSLIFGPPRNLKHEEFCSQLKKTMLSLPIPAPLFYEGILPFNAGKFSMSPIHATNVAEFFVKCISKDNSIGKIYNLGGTKNFQWKELIHIIALSSRKLTWKMPAPVFFVKLLASFLDKYRWFPVTRDQLKMLLEGNTVEKTFFSEFDIAPIEFDKNSLSYLSD